MKEKETMGDERGGISLRSRILILFVLVTCTSGIAILAISGRIIRKVTEDRIESAYDNSLTMLVATIEHVMDNMELLSQQLSFGMGIADGAITLSAPDTDAYEKVQCYQEIVDVLRQMTFANVDIGLVFFMKEDQILVSNFNISKGLEEKENRYLCNARELTFYGPGKSIAGYNSGDVLCLIRGLKVTDDPQQDIYIGVETNYNTLERLIGKEDGVRGIIFVNDRGKVCYSSIEGLCPIGAVFADCVSDRQNLGEYRYFLKRSEMGFSVVELVDMQVGRGIWVGEFGFVFAMLTGFVAVILFFSVKLWKNVYSPLKLFDEELASLLDEGEKRHEVRITGIKEYDRLLNRIGEMHVQIQNMVHEIILREDEKGKMQLEKLRYQINPHFLMNTLNTVHWLAVMNEQTDIDKVIQALNRLLFYNLDKDGYYTDIERELAAVGEYLMLQKSLRYEFSYQIVRNPEKHKFIYSIPKFILQPIVENSLTHGYREGMHIEIRVQDKGEVVEIAVLDDGIGIGQVRLGQLKDSLQNTDRQGSGKEAISMGIGLEYVVHSLEEFYREGEEKAVFAIESRQSGGTEVRIAVPKVKIQETRER